MKKIWYELDQQFFAGQKNGAGSYEGIEKSISYFLNLNINNLILQDIFFYYGNVFATNDSKLIHENFSMYEFRRMVENLRKSNIKIYTKLDLSNVNDVYKNYLNLKNILNNKVVTKETSNNTVDFLNNENSQENIYHTQSYFLKTQTLDFEGSWASNDTINKLKEIIEFYNSVGISGFVIHNFEYLYSKQTQEIFSEKTHAQMRNIYQIVKENFKFLEVIWESELINWSFLNSKKIDVNSLFDHLIDNSFGTANKSYKYEFPLYKEINMKSFNSNLANAFDTNKNIFTIQPNSIGRINSLWGNENSLWVESTRSLIMLALFNAQDNKFYAGQELGMINLNDEFTINQNDSRMNEAKHFLANKGISNEEFNYSFVKFNGQNLHYDLIWTQANSNNRNLKQSAKFVIETQWKDQHSNISFYKKFANLMKDNAFNEILNKSIIKVYKSGGKNFVIDYTYKNDFFDIRLISNLENNYKKVKIKNNAKILASSYWKKQYVKLPVQLNPFETIIVFYSKDNSESDFIKTLFDTKLEGE